MMKITRNIIVLCSLLLAFSANASSLPEVLPKALPEASNPLVIEPGFTRASRIGTHMDLLEDPTGELTIEQAIRAAREGKFVHSERPEGNFGTRGSVWWVHLTLVNKSDKPRSFIFEQGYPHIDHLLFWEQVDGKLQQRASGDQLTFDKREVATNALSFVINLSPGSHSVFLRYQTKGVMTIDLSVYDPVIYAEVKSNKQMIQGLFFGALFALALYNLFIYFIVRDNDYLRYIAYILSYGMFIAGFKGYTWQYIWPDSPALANIAMLFFWALVTALALVFSKHFLRLKEHFPRLNQIATVFIVFTLMVAFGSFFLPYVLLTSILLLLAPVTYTLVLISGYRCIRIGSSSARYFMTAWVTLMVSSIIATLLAAGVFPSYASYAPYASEFGGVVEMVLLSIALASRIRSLEHDTQTDGLTRLYNRRHFDQQLPRALETAQREKSTLALILLDVDHFKKFNDNYGHDHGDRVLQQVGDILKNTARETDIVFRYGGEEFAIILPRTTKDNASVIAERLRKAIAEHDTQGTQVTVSVGLTIREENDETDVQTLFKQADESLYKAKQNGRNQVVLNEVKAAS